MFGHFGGERTALFRQVCPCSNSILAGTGYIAGMGHWWIGAQTPPGQRNPL